MFSAAANVPLSVWYLRFYCNPRLQEAVLNKILLDGFGVTANLYGRYAETYIHHETDVSNDDEIEVDEHKSGKTSSKYLDLVNFSYLWTLGPANFNYIHKTNV